MEAVSYDDDVITGEAVLVDIRPASFVSRALCIAVDLAAMALVGLVLGLLVLSNLPDAATSAAVALVTGLAIVLGFPVLVETVTRGKSLGKWLGGLRVVRDDAGPIRFRHALIRGLLAVVELYSSFGSIAMIVSLGNRRGKRLGDLLAGTYVVRERQARPPMLPPPMPPQLAGWALNADLGRLPDRLALAVRQFLGRGATLAPAARERLARELADQVSGLVAPQPPDGTPAEQFLAAVMAERGRREFGRLSAEIAARRRRDDERRRATTFR